MSVQFILGRSGAGKTSYCIRGVVDALVDSRDERSLLLLVPEQATYQAERAILADRRVGGYHRLHVLSFSRLQFLLLGKNTAAPRLSRLGRQMVIQRILREQKDKLKVFGSSADRPGLGQRMAETVSELHQYGKTADDIEQLVKELEKDERNNLTALKFGDVGVILAEYMRFIEGKFIDPDVQLGRSCQRVAEADFVKDARLWVDGFAGFTTSQLAVLTELLKVVVEARIALCLDASKVDLTKPNPKGIDPVSIFGPTEQTYAELVEIVRKCKRRLAEPIVLGEAVRFSGCPALGHIERESFEPEPEKVDVGNSVRIVSTANGRAEVKFVAREILRLVKERNYRYRDIAVIASDIDYYQHYVRAHFEDYGIPFFIDKRKALDQHPVVALVSSALQAVTGGFSCSDIFAYLKTDLVPVERCDVDLLENYCLAFGITGRDWVSGQEWCYAGEDKEHFDEGRINEIRKRVSGPLLELRDKLGGGGDGGKGISAVKFAGIIFDFLETLGIPKKVGSWIEEATEKGDYARRDEHQQFYERLVDIFDELAEVFGEKEMGCGEWLAIISSAFSQMELAFIPATLDQVLVGSIERSRHPDLKAVFLIGATQRQFPVPVSWGSILTEADRAACESKDFGLAASCAERLIERQYLAYIAFTRASEFLCVSYPLADEKGSSVVRSQFVDNLQGLFEELREESVSAEQIDAGKVNSEAELADLLCGELGRDGLSAEASGRKQLAALLNEVVADEQLGELGLRVRSSLDYENRAELNGAIVKDLFGREIRSSATRLGTFAACPYQYFATYILGLEEREEFKFEPLDVGLFYHRVLDGLLKRLNSEREDFASIGEDELLGLLRNQMGEFIQKDPFVSNFLRHSAHNAFIIHAAGEVLEDCVLAIREMVGVGEFRPEVSEVSFGQVKDAKETLGEYRIELADKRVLYLGGKIDRVDVAEIEGGKAATVFDYKRRTKWFGWSQFYYGLDMQLGIYMLAVRNASERQYKVNKVAGAFFMPVEVSATKTTLEGLAETAESFGYKARGIFNGEFWERLDKGASKDSRFYNFYVTKDGQPYGSYGNRGALRPEDFEAVLEFTEKKMVELAGEIVSGRIDVRPYRLGGDSPCRWCKYKSVCRFDWQVNEYNFLESLGKSEVLERVRTVDG
ncbi:MAG: exodeoxyribonuclease V subunit gamma [Planctomycetota bacterium]|nr:MAG: exodeoxyribonuclease V subunit gamma [Planctomycetota bacterium]